jgi:hypothetical protein
VLDQVQISKILTKERVCAVVSFLFPIIIFLLTLNTGGAESVNIVAVQASMVQNHSLSVALNTTDTVAFGGSRYIVYAPGLAFISLPFAAIGFFFKSALDGYKGNAVLMDELFLSICASSSGLVMYNICKFYSKNKYVCLLTSLTLTLATGVWPFAVSVVPHDASLFFSIFSVYLLLNYVKSETKNNYYPLIAGLSIGVATLLEYASGLFIFPMLAYFLLVHRKQKGLWTELIGFLGTFAVSGVGLNLAYNYTLFGNPLVFPQQVYVNGLHFFFNKSFLIQIAYNLISPYRGLFLMSPVIILGVYGLYEMMQSQENRIDALLFLSLFLTILIYYSAWQGWDAGFSYGQRFLILGLPYLVIPVATLLSKTLSDLPKVVFVLLFAVSSFVQGIGAFAGSAPSEQSITSYQATSYALPKILQGKFAVWWILRIWIGDYVVIMLCVGLVFTSIFILIGYLTFRKLLRYKTLQRSRIEKMALKLVHG